MTDTTENDQEEWPDVHRPHDKLFKLTFREKERLADFMKHHLPTEVTGLMDLANLRIEPETFLDEKFSENYSDIIAQVNLSGKPAFVYFLFEHKSAPDEQAVWQFLQYMVQQWKKDLEDKKGLIPVIPVLFTHGERLWEYKTFPELFKDVPKILLEYIPDFRYILHDISPEAKTKIQGGIIIRIVQLLMRAAAGKDREDEILEALELMGLLADLDNGERWMEILFRYILATTNIRLEKLTVKLREARLTKGEDFIMSTMQKLIDKGFEKGIEQGIEQNKLETARGMLARNYPLEDVLAITGLSREELTRAGILR